MVNKLKSYQLFERIILYLLSIKCEELGKISVQTLADEFSIGRVYLYEIFKKYAMVAPSIFILKTKLIRTAFMLESPKYSSITIERIGQIIGFERPDYFREIFKGFWGTTPSLYRKCKISTFKKSTEIIIEPTITPVKSVSILNDSGLFGFNFVFIIESFNEHSLIVHDHKKGLLFDMKYKSLANAKRGFLRNFGDTYTSENPTPDWSGLIVPNENWWSEKIQFIQTFPKRRTRRKKKFVENEA